MEGGVRKRGNTWYYYFEAGKVDGKRKKIERKGGNTKKEALESLRNALNEFNNTGSFLDETSMSVSDYLDYWYKEYVMINCKYNTQQFYKQCIDNHIKPYFGMYKLKQITTASLQEFMNYKFINGTAKHTLKNYLGIITKSFRMSVYPYKLLKVDPSEHLQMPKYDNIKREEFKTLSIEDYNRIITRFPLGSSFYIPLQIAFHTGMRAAEVCGLTWDCIDIINKSITIEKILVYKGRGVFDFGTPKTQSSYRTLNIGDTLVDILKHHKQWQEENKKAYGIHYINTDFVCTKENGENVTMNSIKYLSRIVNLELGIDFNFHALRHTHATMLLESNAHIKDIQRRLGHSRLSTTMDIYSHVTKQMSDNTVDIFENIIKQGDNRIDG